MSPVSAYWRRWVSGREAPVTLFRVVQTLIALIVVGPFLWWAAGALARDRRALSRLHPLEIRRKGAARTVYTLSAAADPSPFSGRMRSAPRASTAPITRAGRLIT